MTENDIATDNGTSNTGGEQGKNLETAEPSLLAFNREEILKECAALIVYISRHGDVLPDKATDETEINQDEINDLRQAYEDLIKGVMTCNSPESTPDDWRALVMAYTKVTRFTYARKGVNGRSVLDTLGGTMQIFQAETEKPHRRWSLSGLTGLLFPSKRQNRLMWYAGFFLLAALLLELVTGWSGRIDDPSKLAGFWKHLYNATIDLAHILVPASWGAIGACVFLMKRISDKLGILAYEQSRQKGVETRILLGAILAVVMVGMIFPMHSQNLAVGDVNLGPMGLAFIVGLSIKPIYAAFETLVQALAERFSPKK